MVRIGTAKRNDLARIAECHISAFPKSLSSALGKRFVMRMLEWYLSSHRTFLFYLERDDVVLGYCGGLIKNSDQSMGSASSMAQYSFNAGLSAFLVRPWLVFHREVRLKYSFILRNILRHLRYRSEIDSTAIGQTVDGFSAYVSLVVIGVCREMQGKGYGTILLKEFENRAVDLGYNKLSLTVITKNEKAIRAYIRNGWNITHSTPQSTTMQKIIE